MVVFPARFPRLDPRAVRRGPQGLPGSERDATDRRTGGGGHGGQSRPFTADDSFYAPTAAAAAAAAAGLVAKCRGLAGRDRRDAVTRILARVCAGEGYLDIGQFACDIGGADPTGARPQHCSVLFSAVPHDR